MTSPKSVIVLGLEQPLLYPEPGVRIPEYGMRILGTVVGICFDFLVTQLQ
jgi:hypothetical protein